MQQQLVVIGGGAAGFFCAVNAARMNPSIQVTIIEKTSKVLSKVKVSGGGRCNVTHACFEIDALVRRYPRGQNFLKKALHWFSSTDTIEWFKERGVELKTEVDGRMFPVTNNAQTIIDCLLREADQYGVNVITSCDIKQFEVKEGCFHLRTAKAETFSADFLCIACGGFPKAAQFDWLIQSGHSIVSPVPSLFTFNIPNNPITALMGVSTENAIVKIIGTKLQEQGPLLITHWGISGPSVLRLSAWGARMLAEKEYHFSILVNWLPLFNEQSLQEQWPKLRNQMSSQKVSSKNPFQLPNRLWLYLLEQSGIDEFIRWSDINSKQQNKLIQHLTAQLLEVKGKTTFKEEFVTCGGINLQQIDANTMQSRIVPNLFFAGEVLDIDGVTGGFNFQNAWTTGWIAAKKISDPK